MTGKATWTRPKAIVVGLFRDPQKMWEMQEDLAELRRLVEDAGAEVVAVVTQHRRAPHPGFYVGKGKAREIASLVRETGAEMVVFDDSLRPVQVKHLEDTIGVKILDRVQLILDIFARRARTREGQLQVELAQLQYLLPRLTGRGIELSRLGGGIGTRGPGETLLEMKQRRIRDRIRHIREELRRIAAHHAHLHRERREKSIPVFALVGYTNAGKSTLFNRLTGAGVHAQDQLFTTLEPRVRKVQLGDLGMVLVSDTVGFIRKLPPWLVAAFRATLDEVYESDALIHVIDITSSRMQTEIATVERILKGMRVHEKPILRVFNKIDLLDRADPLLEVRVRNPEAIFVSARTGEGIETLLFAMEDVLHRAIRADSAKHWQRAEFYIPYPDMAKVQWFYRVGRILHREDRDGGVYIVAEVPQWLIGRMQAYRVVSEVTPAPASSAASSRSS